MASSRSVPLVETGEISESDSQRVEAGGVGFDEKVDTRRMTRKEIRQEMYRQVFGVPGKKKTNG